MDDFLIELIPYNKPQQEFKVVRFEKEFNDDYADLYCELSYTINVLMQPNTTVDLYINDEFYERSNNNTFYIKQGELNQYFGLVYFSFAIHSTTEVQYYKSSFFNCCFQQNKNKDLIVGIDNMIKYIEENNHIVEAVSKNVIKKLDFVVYDKLNQDNLIDILNKVVILYHKHYSAFMHRPHKTSIRKDCLVDFEKVSYISQESIINILSYPEFLYECDYNSGIEFEDKHYVPNKIIAKSTLQEIDNYENRVVVGFLITILNFLNNQKSSVVEVEKELTSNVHDDEYISYSRKLQIKSRANIMKYKNEIELLYVKFGELYKKYNLLFNLSSVKLIKLPQNSKVFENVKHYRDIYYYIRLWFSTSKVSLVNERINLHLAKSSLLFEHYTLLKIINYMIEEGWECQNKSIVQYSVNKKALYTNLPYFNKFEFKRNGSINILYYQPVINKYSHQEGINLYRSVSFSLERKGTYYTPDYIMKIINGEQEYYNIIDAKMSDVNSVIYKQLKNLAFKYNFSINTINEKCELGSTQIICGKSSVKNNVELPDISNPVSGSIIGKNKFLFYTLDPKYEYEESYSKETVCSVKNIV